MGHKIKDSEAINLWTNDLYSLRMIAKELGVSAYGVQKCLNRHGIDTSKAATWQTVACNFCGREFKMQRGKARATRKPCCSRACYHLALFNPNYNPNRHGGRIARRVASEAYRLLPTDIVHHRDTDQTNNDLDNLMVFASQADHIKWHRLGGIKSGVVPVFMGIEQRKAA